MTANRECVPSSSPSPSSYLDVLLKKKKKKKRHVWLNKSSCNLSLCNYLPTPHHSNAVRCWPDPGTQQLRKQSSNEHSLLDLYIFLLRTGQIQCKDNYVISGKKITTKHTVIFKKNVNSRSGIRNTGVNLTF